MSFLQEQVNDEAARRSRLEKCRDEEAARRSRLEEDVRRLRIFLFPTSALSFPALIPPQGFHSFVVFSFLLLH